VARRLGQHFLVRESILDRIARAACNESCGTVVEIGPGRGALTRHLLPLCERLIALEIDPILVQYLRAKFRAEPKAEILERDVLKADLASWGRVTVAGNLPYYITSPILDRVLALNGLLARAVFLVQKEVAERLTAQPGSRDYGYLTVRTQLFADVAMLFPVPAAAFRPPPKVDSAVVRLTPRTDLPEGAPQFAAFAALCFHQKRKNLRNNLRAVYPAIDHQPEASKRAEQLGIDGLIELWRRLKAESAA